MEAITNGIAVLGNYVYQIGEATVIGASNAAVNIGQGLVGVGRAIFLGLGIGG